MQKAMQVLKFMMITVSERMTDLIKCEGHGCPIKDHCYRFTSMAEVKREDLRYDPETGCDYFMEGR